MEKQLDYAVYFDKVYGCWLGKCICGTIGAPYEGMKQMISLDYSPELFAEMLPNDDLDLQVLWLEGLEQKGIHIAGDDLAKLFSEKNILWPGEYAWFKKNYDRDICPPYTGIYENDFYFEGMGCPIRGEIWGMIYPGNPDGAEDICQIDGTLDHYGNSVYFEQFWSAMIAASFFESRIPALLDIGMDHMPKDSRAYALVRDVRQWCDREEDIGRIRSRILAKYGHRDCTNSFQNMGIIVMSLLKGEGDMIKSTMMAVRQGFDTDCTAGNVGALLGAVMGARHLEKEYGFRDAGYKLTLNYKRKTDRVYDLAADTCRVGLYFIREGRSAVTIANAPDEKPWHPKCEAEPVTIHAEYGEGPYLQPGEEIRIGIVIQNHTDRGLTGMVTAEPSDALEVFAEDFVKGGSAAKPMYLSAGKKTRLILHVRHKADVDYVSETNAVTVKVTTQAGQAQRRIGVVGKTPYRVFGPFWDNIVSIPKLNPKESYYSKIPGVGRENYTDIVRCYHLNTRVDPQKEYMTALERSGNGDRKTFEKEGEICFCEGDVIRMKQICAFDGPCAVYLRRVIVCQEEQTVHLNLGHTDAFELWINGESVCRCLEPEGWTPENIHLFGKKLRKGNNEIMIKLIRQREDAKFTMTFLKADPLMEALAGPVPALKHMVGLLSQARP